MSFLALLYALAATLLSIYGFNLLVLTVLYLYHRRESTPVPPLTDPPSVTVQLPIYNEMYVVERLIDAVARLDYPRDKLQIQVLDDSTDETTVLAERCVARHRARGVDIELIHRDERMGFKAGALERGLETARGDLIAIFDADFVPSPDFLKRTVPYFSKRPRLGLIQTRWSHLNADYSHFTRAQAIALDGHFVVEQTARQEAGLFINFNGAAGIWRKECIRDAGGWQADTICEDLDLSYRAQLAGWETLYLPHVASPAEIPPQLEAFKRQQFRWAKGSIQCLRKLWRPVLRSSKPLFVRLQGLIHLGGYLCHPLMLILLLLMLPLMLCDGGVRLPLAYLSLASLGPPIMYVLSQRALYPDWLKRLAYLPVLILLGTGIALNNTCAVCEALLKRGHRFRRTPKFRLEGDSGDWANSRYVLPFDWMTLGEASLALYSLMTTLVALERGNLYAVPFLLLYLGGFGYVAVLGFWPLLTRAVARLGVNAMSIRVNRAKPMPRIWRDLCNHSVVRYFQAKARKEGTFSPHPLSCQGLAETRMLRPSGGRSELIPPGALQGGPSARHPSR